MGQSSLPVLNKSGRSIFWTNVWDDYNYYNIKFEEDIFIKIFFELFFTDNLFYNNFFFSKQFAFKLNNFYYYNYYYYGTKYNSYCKYLLMEIRRRRLIFYFMRFHILRLGSNIVILLKLFFPVNRRFKKRKRKSNQFKYLYRLTRVLKFLNFNYKLKNQIFLKNF